MANDPSAVTPGDSTYSLRTPDTVPAAPIPQMPMERVLPRQTSTGLARGIQQLGSPNVYVDSGNEQIVVAKTDTSSVTTPQVLMGNQVNKGEGFYVTKPGIDVTTASNDSDFIFNSNQNVFKIVMAGTTTLTVADPIPSKQIYTATVPHNLGVIPAFLVYATIPSSAGYYPTGALNPLPISIWSYNAGAAGNINLYSNASADTANLYISIASLWSANLSGVGGTWSFKYYILQETAT